MTTSTSNPLRSQTTTSASSLTGALRRVRHAWWRASLLRAGLLAAAVALAVLPIAWVWTWTAGRQGRLVDLLPTVGPWVGATFGLALLAALLVLGLRTPTLAELARRADRVLGQERRLSTALEVQASGAPGSLLTWALLDDVERRLPSLDWRAVPRTRWPSWSPAVLAVLVVSAVLATVVPIPAAVRLRAARPTNVVGDLPERDAAAVRRFAEVLAGVAETEESAYLQAVAASFADLADQIAAGTIDAASAARRLDELVEHLGAAAEEVSPAFAEAVRSSLSPAAAEASADSAAAGQDAAEGDAAAAEAGANPEASPDLSAIEADASMYMALEDFANEVGRNPGGVGLRAQRPSPQDLDEEGAFYGGVMRAETDPNAPAPAPSGLRSDAAGGGDVVGAAEQSSERAGDAAGDGGADLAGGADAFLGLDAASEAVAALPANQRDDGRFVDVELVPDEELGRARNANPVAGAGPAFQRADEATTTVRSIRPTYRDVVGRYFMPGSVTAERAP